MLDLTVDSDAFLKEELLNQNMKKVSKDLKEKKNKIRQSFEVFFNEVLEYKKLLPKDHKFPTLYEKTSGMFTIQHIQIIYRIGEICVTQSHEFPHISNLFSIEKINKEKTWYRSADWDTIVSVDIDHYCSIISEPDMKYKDQIEQLYRSIREDRLRLLEKSLETKTKKVAELSLQLEF